jgi:hypothetical protein
MVIAVLLVIGGEEQNPGFRCGGDGHHTTCMYWMQQESNVNYVDVGIIIVVETSRLIWLRE